MALTSGDQIKYFVDSTTKKCVTGGHVTSQNQGLSLAATEGDRGERTVAEFNPIQSNGVKYMK